MRIIGIETLGSYKMMIFIDKPCLGLGCYNEVPPNEQFINNMNLFFTVLEAGSPRLWCYHGQVRVLFCIIDLLQYYYMVEGMRDLCEALL